MKRCTEQMLEMEQPDELYEVGRILRMAFERTVELDLPAPARVLLTHMHDLAGRSA